MTPLQELLNWVDKELKLYGYEHKEIMLKVLDLMEKERDMVNDSFIEGKMSEAGLSNILNGNEFYNNFNNK